VRVAILGVGEAGSRFAVDLAALGVDVAPWDPDPDRRAEGIEPAASTSAAVTGSEVVLSLCSAAAALAAATAAAPALGVGTLYADLNSAAPALKREVDAVVARTGAVFADVALLGPVPKRGARTPALVSGSGAQTFAAIFGPLEMPVEVVEGGAGAAAARKLVRSVFMKGLAASAVESLRAARAAGCEPWLAAEITRVLDGPGAPLLERLVEGTAIHAVRRIDEMKAACELLEELGVEPHVARASAASLEDLSGEQDR
jgi:3-hydroxyisobutyrate dehydrogenase-like beta-hydroxyacid dehydrogenase